MQRQRTRARFVRQSGRSSTATTSTSTVTKSRSTSSMAGTNGSSFGVPPTFLNPPLLQDNIQTQTSDAQEATIRECLPLLGAALNPARSPFDFNEFGVPELRREDHVDFLHENLAEFPAPFVGLDAARPWLVYWGLMGLFFLGEDVSAMRQRFVVITQPTQRDKR